MNSEEVIADIIMELVPDVITEFFSDSCFRFIWERVENPFLQKLLCGLAVILLVVFSVVLGLGILLIFGVKLG